MTPKHINALLTWYKKNHRDFPWRTNPDPYWVWLAEIMSQQTQMATLVPYFHRFIEKFPAVEALARASEEEVLSAWTGLGYYSRARNIHRAAQKIVQELGGFPQTYEGWLDLPGVGPYTAAAVVSQCFGVREPVWDGNVVRVSSRLLTRSDAHAPAFRAEMELNLRRAMAGHDPSHFNQALMELGATVCTPKNPQCGKCPLQTGCKAYAASAVGEFPPPKARKAVIEINPRVWVQVRASSWHGSGRGPEVFLQKREAGLWFSGMWDFPSELGGVADPVRLAKVDLRKFKKFGKAKHSITHHKIALEGMVAFEGVVKGEGRWFLVDDLISEKPPVPLSTTARKMLRELMKIKEPRLL